MVKTSNIVLFNLDKGAIEKIQRNCTGHAKIGDLTSNEAGTFPDPKAVISIEKEPAPPQTVNNYIKEDLLDV